MRKIFLIFLSLSIIAFMNTSCSRSTNKTESIDKNKTESIDTNKTESIDLNCTGNITNGSLFAESNGWVYYCEVSDYKTVGSENQILYDTYKIRADGSKKSLLFHGLSTNLYVDGKWLYYLDESRKINRISADGKENKVLSNIKATQQIVSGDWIYFISETDNFVYRIDLEGEDESKLCGDAVKSMSIINDMLYYLDGDSLYSADLDGDNNKLIIDSCSYFSIIDECIYYNNSDGEGLFKSSMDGVRQEKITDGQATFMNVLKKVLYYSDENMNLHKVNIDGSEKIDLNTSGLLINILDDKIYFVDITNKSTFSEISDDGNIEKDVFVDP